jgi:hypothetical protein
VNHAAGLVNRYIAIWNERDAERRRTTFRQLWTDEAIHVFQPPQEALEPAAALDVTAIFQARGHTALEARVARTYEEFVAPGQFSFRLRDQASRLGEVVKFNWEMVATDGQVPPLASSSSRSRRTDGSGSTTSSSRVERLANGHARTERERPLWDPAMDLDACPDQQ